MIKIASSAYTLADAFEYIEQQRFPLARTITQAKLDELIKISPQFKEPTHQAVKIKYRENDSKFRLLVYSNLGYPFFNNGDILEKYNLDQETYFFDYKLNSNKFIEQYASYEIRFSAESNIKWTAQFDYEVIFEHFGLDGHGDFAPFMGVFKLS